MLRVAPIQQGDDETINRAYVQQERLTIHDQNIIIEYNRARHGHKKALLSEHTKADRDTIYHYFLNELNLAIQALSDQDSQHADLARDVYQQLERTRQNKLQKYKGFKITDKQIFDVLHRTTDLITTPPLHQNGQHNPDFFECAQHYSRSIDELKGCARTNALKCAGYTLGAALMIAAAVLVTVLTFGSLAAVAKLTFDVVAFALINIGGNLSFGLYVGAKTVGFFNQSYQASKIANKMAALDKAFVEPHRQVALENRNLLK